MLFKKLIYFIHKENTKEIVSVKGPEHDEN